MFAHSNHGTLRALCVLSAVWLSVTADEVLESRPGMVHELRRALAELAGEGRAHLGRLAGEQTVRSVQKAFSQVLAAMAQSLSAGLNVVLQNVSHLLQAAGLQVSFPVSRVTPEGLIFVTQWLLLALIGYWLISLLFRLVASTLRRALWLLKVGLALVCFGFILSDHSVDTDTMVVRLVVLVSVCVLMGVGTSGSSNAADKTSHLEEQVKVLQRRLRDVESWRRTEE